MFLKSLTLKGFKSFAETTVLDLEPGVTVVVGPNGSGKSNVVDAIGWVLGAQAPSSVRSQKMDDVIFAGTAKRAALGRAEVSLTIDNSAGLLPIEFSEVTVTRTLFRRGDSEYAINGSPCRLLDVQELLSDSGVGRQQHVIVGQGQIDAVLNARPEDRRLIIEEAAGVLKYRKRKEKAERRMAATEANLHRLADLLREVRSQLRPLERQAEAARRHGDVAAELRGLRLFLVGRELTTLDRRRADAAAARGEADAEATIARRRLVELDAAVIDAESRLGRSEVDDLAALAARLDALRERARGQGALLAERSRGVAREQAAAIDATVVATLEAEAARLADELVELSAAEVDLAPAAEELDRAQQALEDARRSALDAPGTAPEPESDGVDAVARAAEIRGELAARRGTVERAAADERRSVDVAERLSGELDAARTYLERLEVEASPGWRAAQSRQPPRRRPPRPICAPRPPTRAPRRPHTVRPRHPGRRRRRGPRPSPRLSTTSTAVPARSAWPGWRASWAPCSIWW